MKPLARAGLAGTLVLVPALALPTMASAAPAPSVVPAASYDWCGQDYQGGNYICISVSPTTAKQWAPVTIEGSLNKLAMTQNKDALSQGLWLWRLQGNTWKKLDIMTPVASDGSFRMIAKLGVPGAYEYRVGVDPAYHSGDDPVSSAPFGLVTTGPGTPWGTVTPKVYTSVPKTIVVKDGSPVQFRLKSNITTGYTYRVDTVRDNADTVVVGPSYVPPKNPIPGRGGTTVVTAYPGHSGVTVLKFEYVGPGGDVAQTNKVKITWMND